MSFVGRLVRDVVNLRIQSEYRKILTRKNSVFGHLSRSALYINSVLKFLKVLNISAASVSSLRLIFSMIVRIVLRIFRIVWCNFSYSFKCILKDPVLFQSHKFLEFKSMPCKRALKTFLKYFGFSF